MITHDSVTKWLQDYISAWKSYDPAAIGALFTEDATYRYNPFDNPVSGREAIVANWIENRDAPDTYDAEYKVIAINGNVAVSNGRSKYYQPGTEPGSRTLARQFDNIFVIHFDDDGRCVDFCEWFMEPRRQ